MWCRCEPHDKHFPAADRLIPESPARHRVSAAIILRSASGEAQSMTGLFIRGGWHQGFGPYYDRFPIDDRLTVFQAVIAFGADTNPNDPIIASLYGSSNGQRSTTISDVMTLKTVEGMRNRKRALEEYSPQAAAIYRQMKEEYKTGSFPPERLEYCGDSPDTLDFTRCVYRLDQVLSLIRRRGDRGWLIEKLVASDAATAVRDTAPPKSAETTAPPQSTLSKTGTPTEFAAAYIARERDAGRGPKQSGENSLLEAWQTAGRIGHRAELRETFKTQMNGSAPGRGRPRKIAK